MIFRFRHISHAQEEITPRYLPAYLNKIDLAIARQIACLWYDNKLVGVLEQSPSLPA
ncbi:hypothetical protein JYQ62_03080 [Nostoc sp. UHCC 0702]|nr:hypothetical protein JYQ62_03080 [Nostoc sp. UHCC 0702]